jgi:hypothetical protein
VTAADVNGLTNKSWFGSVDARILANIQAGYIQASGGPASDVGGVAEWVNAWRAVKKEEDADQINSLVAQAESASIVQGRDEAAALGRSPSLGEALAMTASDTFRVSQ